MGASPWNTLLVGTSPLPTGAPRTSTSVPGEPEPEQPTSLEKKSYDSAAGDYEVYERRCGEPEEVLQVAVEENESKIRKAMELLREVE